MKEETVFVYVLKVWHFCVIKIMTQSQVCDKCDKLCDLGTIACFSDDGSHGLNSDYLISVSGLNL